MTKDLFEEIDNMSKFDLVYNYRYLPSNHPLTQGDVGDYLVEKFREFKEKHPEEFTKISKEVERSFLKILNMRSTDGKSRKSN